jgi:hypothetical protein
MLLGIRVEGLTVVEKGTCVAYYKHCVKCDVTPYMSRRHLFLGGECSTRDIWTFLWWYLQCDIWWHFQWKGDNPITSVKPEI